MWRKRSQEILQRKQIRSLWKANQEKGNFKVTSFYKNHIKTPADFHKQTPVYKTSWELFKGNKHAMIASLMFTTNHKNRFWQAHLISVYYNVC